jgi:uncharacterized protein YecT (DUF1311 family)
MMRGASVFAVAALLAAGSARAADDDPFKSTDCKKATTQMDLDYCAGQDFKKVDGQLNVLYRKMMPRYGAADQALLKDAERKWVAWRDAECAFDTNLSAGGTIHPMVETTCQTEKTNARIKELQTQIKCGDGDTMCDPPDK